MKKRCDNAKYSCREVHKHLKYQTYKTVCWCSSSQVSYSSRTFFHVVRLECLKRAAERERNTWVAYKATPLVYLLFHPQLFRLLIWLLLRCDRNFLCAVPLYFGLESSYWRVVCSSNKGGWIISRKRTPLRVMLEQTWLSLLSVISEYTSTGVGAIEVLIVVRLSLVLVRRTFLTTTYIYATDRQQEITSSKRPWFWKM